MQSAQGWEVGLSRRTLLKAGVSAAAVGQLSWTKAAEVAPQPELRRLHRQVGITTSSVDAHFSPTGESGRLPVTDLPAWAADQLEMTVLDLNTRTLGSPEAAGIEAFAKAAQRAGSVVTNIKLNQVELDLGSADVEVRRRTLAEYRRWIDAARILGALWVRPFPSRELPDVPLVVEGYRELIDYGRQQSPHVGLLVENYGWLTSDADSAAALVEQIGPGVYGSPDTGNWDTNELRRAGLKRFFPLAATCDFKARQLGPGGEHPLYDLRECFEIGWQAGFRGPWCLEHAHADRRQLVADLRLLARMLHDWMNQAG